MLPHHRKTSAGDGDPARPLSDLGDVAAVQAALRRVAAIAAAAEPPEAVFDAVTAEGSALLGGVLLSLARYEGGGSEAVILAQTGGHVTVGSWFPGTNPLSITYRAWQTANPSASTTSPRSPAHSMCWTWPYGPVSPYP